MIAEAVVDPNEGEVRDATPSVMSFLYRHALEQPSRRAVVDGRTGEAITYAQFFTQARAVAAQLVTSGVGKGDRVGMLALNSLPGVVLLFALADVGAIAVPQNLRLHPSEMATNLQDAGVAAIASDAAFTALAGGIAEGLGVAGRFVIDAPAEGWVQLERTATPTGLVSATAASGNDTATLLYTSGTTGQAKGCMLAHRTWVGYAQNMATSMRMSRDDTYLAFLPIFHVAGLGLVMSQLLLGGTVVTLASPDPALMHALIKEHEVTVFMLVPGVSGPFVNHPDAAPAGSSSLRLFISGAGMEAKTVVDGATERLGVEYCGIYGQTESGTKTTWASAADIASRPGTYGRVMPGLAYRIVDEDDNDVEDGQPGELLLRGATVMQGYWNRPEATAETLRGGWHHTGDVFVHEGDGWLRMVDRTKYLVKTGGENVYPQEVEVVLMRHADVADVAVVGVPDETWGETVKAFIVPREGADPTREELDTFVRLSVAGYKAPRFIEYVETIPRNVSGKILKNVLAARPTEESMRLARDQA